MSTAQEKANLARIRDNQRRSRARRKEYLQELEARLRQCELQGIEASAEIQIAARKVADENRKLRSLLAQRGVSDDHVDAYLKSGDSNLAEQYGSTSIAVQNLETLLTTRKNAYADGGWPLTAMGRRAASRSSSATASTVQSLWDTQSQRLPTKDTPGCHQFMSPNSTVSRTSSVSLGQVAAHSIPQFQHGLGSVALVSNPSPSLGRQASQYEIDPQLSFPNPSYSDLSEPSLRENKHARGSSTSMYIPATSGTNMSSCVFATDMITTMAGADQQAVREELGCIPGLDCDVDNQLVFNIMDRYTGSNAGL